jgi:YVTN family beta-propeller protein
MSCAKSLLVSASVIALLVASPLQAEEPIRTATGVSITPLAAPGSSLQQLAVRLPGFWNNVADHPQSIAVSPDKSTMLVLTSGYNLKFGPGDNYIPADTGEFIFIYSLGTQVPRLKQVLKINNAYSGVVWAPSGQAFYVAGGQDDNVHVFTQTGSTWGESAASPIALSHGPDGSGDGPVDAGLGITADGKTLIAANYMHDSISFINLQTNTYSGDLDLRPGKNNPAQTGVPGGEFPFWVAVAGSSTAYVSSERDHEIVVVNLTGAAPSITARIKTVGVPNKMVLNAAQTRLYVAADNADQLYVIDTTKNKIIAQVSTTAPAGLTTSSLPAGSNPNSVVLSPDEATAYVTDSASNAVAVIDLVPPQPVVTGLIPTGWLPNAAALSADGGTLYVADGKEPAGPNLYYCSDTWNNNNRDTNCDRSNEYIYEDMASDLLTIPVPSAATLAKLTQQVARNNGFGRVPSEQEAQTMAFLHQNIKHIIYIVKENRTYDQILGDLPKGNGDPSKTELGQAYTPNFHAMASNFVDLDNFYCSGEVSMDGWQWSTAGHATDTLEKTVPVNYGKGGVDYDSEGDDRSVNVFLKTPAERHAFNGGVTLDPDYLPGSGNEMAIDGDSGEKAAGYLWNGALAAGLTIRNYGMFGDTTNTPYQPYPFQAHAPAAVPSDPRIAPYTDLYFYPYDQTYPDFFRFTEWAREFNLYVKNNTLPNLEFVRLSHDHMGHFYNALYGVNTPETESADNDYSVALIVDLVNHSPYAGNTLIMAVEDDAQDGGDHVDAHRSTAYVVGPYVKQGAVVSTPYTTVNMVATIETILGIPHMHLQSAGVPPMTDVFDTAQAEWTFSAVPAAILYTTSLPILNKDKPRVLPHPAHDAAWWEQKTKGMNFDKPDAVDPVRFNRILWEGLKGTPYPADRSGRDLRVNRAALLKSFGD